MNKSLRLQWLQGTIKSDRKMSSPKTEILGQGKHFSMPAKENSNTKKIIKVISCKDTNL